MALRRATPLTFRPRGLSDAVDGSNVFPGAMRRLVDLVPDPAMNFAFVCRPAAVEVGDFAPFASPGFVSGMLVVGDLCYGMVASARNPGNDEPFVYNLATDTYVSVVGVTAGNTPASPPSVGPWTPPKLAVVGSRIIVCHPGFAGGAYKFGWFDVTGFSESATANTASGSAVLTGFPAILGVQPGMTATGTNIPAGATVVSTANFVLNTIGATNTNTTLDSLVSTAGVAVGQAVVGVGIPAGATVAAVVSPTSVTLSQAATASATVGVTFTGATITLSDNATGSTNGESVAIAGGSVVAPLWGSGDTDRNGLPSVPVDVAQFNGRAYYALGTNGIVYSDSGFACRVSNTTKAQALTTNDGVAVTAIAPLMLSTLVGGITQALVAFQGVSRMQQITGDQATSDLAMNALPVATGALSSTAIATCEVGTAFISPEGVRVISFSGTVSPPIGDAGSGITVPFINALVPSRTALACNSHVIRATVQNAAVQDQPWQEYWYELGRQAWIGPMSFVPSLIQPWRNTFVIAPRVAPGSLWQADVVPTVASSYIENGAQMTWVFEPTPLPDTGALAENSLVEMTFACALAASEVIPVAWGQFQWGAAPWGGTVQSSPSIILTATDLNGNFLDQTTIDISGLATLWGGFKWGAAPWGGAATAYQQRAVDWHQPLVFKQLGLSIVGASSFSVRLGGLYMKYEILGYKLQGAA